MQVNTIPQKGTYQEIERRGIFRESLPFEIDFIYKFSSYAWEDNISAKYQERYSGHYFDGKFAYVEPCFYDFCTGIYSIFRLC